MKVESVHASNTDDVVLTPLPDWGGLKVKNRPFTSLDEMRFNTPPGVGRVEKHLCKYNKKYLGGLKDQ